MRASGCGLASASCWPGPFCTQPLGAQVRDTIPKRRDTTHRHVPIPPGADSLLRDRLAKKDSLQRAEARTRSRRRSRTPSFRPTSGSRGSFAGRAIRSSPPARSRVADLLERVPGVTTLPRGLDRRAGVARVHGRLPAAFACSTTASRCRALDPRARGVLDLTQVNICGRPKKSSSSRRREEVRVYIRSWRVRRTTPVTRTDVSTGDQQTNLYRGFFGRRYDDGAALQFGAQQYGTTPPIALRHEQRSARAHRRASAGRTTRGASTRSRRAPAGTAASSSATRPARLDSVARVGAHRRVRPRRARRSGHEPRLGPGRWRSASNYQLHRHSHPRHRVPEDARRLGAARSRRSTRRVSAAVHRDGRVRCAARFA